MVQVTLKKNKNFFLLLKTAYQKKQKVLIYPATNQNLLTILKKLQEKGWIAGYVQDLKEMRIFLRYDRQSLPAINTVFFFPKCRYISLKKIKALNNDYPLSLSFLNTKFGLLDFHECQKKNCGGELIVTIT